MQIVYNDVGENFCEWKYLQEVIKYLEPKLSDEYVLHVTCFSQECDNNKNVKFTVITCGNYDVSKDNLEVIKLEDA